MIMEEPFQLVEEGTKRRRTKLVDSLGYNYNVTSKRSYATYWQCTHRPKGNACRASVVQRDGTFKAGNAGHNHPAKAGTLRATKIIKAVKARALEEMSKPASAIVKEVNTNNCQEYLVFKVFYLELQILSNRLYPSNRATQLFGAYTELYYTTLLAP